MARSKQIYVMMNGTLRPTVCGDGFALVFELGSRAWKALEEVSEPEACPGCGMPMDKLSHGWGPCS